MVKAIQLYHVLNINRGHAVNTTYIIKIIRHNLLFITLNTYLRESFELLINSLPQHNVSYFF